MKVLILHQHFKTPYRGGAIRSYYLAIALVNAGIETVVITAHNDTGYRKEFIDGIEVHYLPIAYDNRFGFLRRSLSFLRFNKNAVSIAGHLGTIDLCYAISVPLTIGIAARRILARFKIPFFFEVGDLWPEAPIQLGYIRNPLFKKALYDLEKRIYESAKSIVALSPSIANDIKKKVPKKIIYCIPNISDTDFYYPSAKNASLEEKFNVKKKFVVSYIGAIGYANGLEYFLSCACAAAGSGLPFHFLMCGDGAELDRLKSEAGKFQLKNFSIIPFQNRDGIKQILNVTDAVFISYRAVPVLETGSPNKYFDGLAAGKLIVMNFGGWIKEEIQRENCGVYVDPVSSADFLNKVSPFLTDGALLSEYQRSARALAERKYSRKMLGEKFVNIIKGGQADSNSF